MDLSSVIYSSCRALQRINAMRANTFTFSHITRAHISNSNFYASECSSVCSAGSVYLHAFLVADRKQLANGQIMTSSDRSRAFAALNSLFNSTTPSIQTHLYSYACLKWLCRYKSSSWACTLDAAQHPVGLSPHTHTHTLMCLL